MTQVTGHSFLVSWPSDKAEMDLMSAEELWPNAGDEWRVEGWEMTR